MADSLALLLKNDDLPDTARMRILGDLSFNEVRDLKQSLGYAEELIRLAEKNGDPFFLHKGYFQKGNKKRMMGDLEEAIAAYFKSEEAARKANLTQRAGMAYSAIADVYSVSGHHGNSMLYYHKAIATLWQTRDTAVIATAILNAGDEFVNHGNYDSALIYFQQAAGLFDAIGYEIGKAYSLGNMGMAYANSGRKELAEQYINEAIPLLEKLEDYHPICEYLISMSEISREKGEVQAARDYALRSLQLARKYELKEQISEANLKLSELYAKEGDMQKAYTHYREHILFRDSVSNVKSVQKMAELRTDFEVSKKQVEVDLLNQQKKNQRNILISLAIILVLAAVILGTLYWYYKAIAREKKRSENLLLNILPAETARELKQNGRVEAVKFEKVTVLFTDFVKFSSVAERTDPEQLVKSIDYYFRGFDEIIMKHGLEKIKTVGDSYMCAGGLPVATEDHAMRVVQAAKEMLGLVQEALHSDDGLTHFEIRIGIHTGPVVAGIVGIKKWQYDIWGDTVNIASRMESGSLPGRINLSETTYQEIRDAFACEYRGEIEVKNRGLLKMYFLSA